MEPFEFSRDPARPPFGVDPFSAAVFTDHPLCRVAEWNSAEHDLANLSLPDAERARLDQLKSPSRRAEAEGSFRLRRGLIGELTHTDASSVRLDALPSGAPVLHDPSGWSLSITNKAHWTAIALERSPASIGIDIEIVRELDWRPMLSMICLPHDAEQLMQWPASPAALRIAFFRMWTLKEAVLKAKLEGFRADPKAVETPLAILQGPGTGRLEAFGESYTFWTAEIGAAIVSLVRKQA